MGNIESVLFPDLVNGKVVPPVQPDKVRKHQKRRILSDPDDGIEDSVVATELPVGVCHYQTGYYKPFKDQHIPDHSVVQDNSVACGTSILILYNGMVLIGKRRSSWWFPASGGIRPGMMPPENCQRLGKEKLGFTVQDLSRFEYVGTYSYVWRMQEEGTHEISIVYAINLQSEEIPTEVSSEEFSDMKWVTVGDVELGDYHPAFRRALRDYHSDKALATLVSSVTSQKDIDVSAIGEKFKTWCSKRLEWSFVDKKVKEDEESMKTDENPKTVAEVEELGDELNLRTDEEVGGVEYVKTNDKKLGTKPDGEGGKTI